MSTLLNKLSNSHHAPSTKVLPLHMSSGDQNIPQPKTSADQNIPHHQMATFVIVKRFREAILFTKAPWLILSDDKYLLVDEAWKHGIEAANCQRGFAGAPVGTQSVS
jgi:hypothetical protein